MNQRDLWNERYLARGAMWGDDPNQFVVERLTGLTPRSVLDMGAGQGRNAIWLAGQGHEVTAIDVSDVAVRQGAEAAATAGVAVDFVVADLEEWQPAAGSFDLVLLAYIQAVPPVRRAIHEKAARALKPGGTVFVVAHHSENLAHGIGGPPVLEVLFDEESLARDFSGYEIVENSQVVRPVRREDETGEALDLLFMAIKPSVE